MVVTINHLKLKISWTKVIYWLIIGFFTLYLASDLRYNTAFVDEAIYATVGEEVLRGQHWENALSWMGGSYFYPYTSALINRQMGLFGIRLYSLICMLATGIIAGKIAKQLGGKTAELIAMGLFLFGANTMGLAQLGTYDAPAFLFISLSLYFAIISRYDEGKIKYAKVALSAFAMALALLSKYIAAMFIPTIALLVFFKGKRSDFLAISFWGLISYTIFGYFVFMNMEAVYDTLTGYHYAESSTLLSIAKETAKYLYVYLITIPPAIYFALKGLKSEKKIIIFALLVGGIMPIAYHVSSVNIRSFWKHLAYSAFFWAPISAWFLNKTYKAINTAHNKNIALNNIAQFSLTASAILVFSFLWVNFSNHWEFQRSWPSTSSAIAYLEENRTPSDRIFAEGSAVYKYHLFSGFEDSGAWTSTWWLMYDGKEGTDAMKAAIWDRHFDYVVLNGYFTPTINDEIWWDLTQNYDVVFTDEYKVFGEYNYTTEIWKPKQASPVELAHEGS